MTEKFNCCADGRLASPESASLFFEIARCENVKAHFELGKASTGLCSRIIATQGATSLGEFRVPEPWCGDLEGAPILFISSNPSIDDASQAFWLSDDRLLWDSHVNLFCDSRWSRDGIYTVLLNGERSTNWVRYWAAVRALAGELLGRVAEPGKDYALTEAVHCKSRGEEGVADAATPCSDRYLRRVLELSTARVLVVFGDTARRRVVAAFGIVDSVGLSSPLLIAGRERIILCLPHPNARKKRRIRNFVSAEGFRNIERFLVGG